jgi:dienelactone hydrolase
VYISKPADYPHTPTRLLLFLTGGTGIKSVNNQIQADKYAAEGFLVLMPDMFGGETAPGGKEAYVADNSVSLLEQVKLKAVEIAKSFLIDMWLARVTEAKILPILHKVIEAAHENYADAIKQGEGIYAVGYCVGGRYVLLLAQGTQEGGNDEETGILKAVPYIKAGALAHAASVTPDDFRNLQAPLSLVCVENDALFTDEVRKAGEDIMTQDNVEHEVQVYPGVPHGELAPNHYERSIFCLAITGFAVAGQYQESNIMDAQVTAYEQMLRWLKDH